MRGWGFIDGIGREDWLQASSFQLQASDFAGAGVPEEVEEEEGVVVAGLDSDEAPPEEDPPASPEGFSALAAFL